jgi:hypothetical protein
MWHSCSFNKYYTQLVDDLAIHSIDCKLLSEADYYGAAAEIAYAIGRKALPRSYSNWLHGWAGSMPLQYPNLLSVSGNRQQTHLVHTIEQKQFLTRHGFSSVYAVGMPVIYARNLSAEICRFKGSLLVMPPHVSKFSKLNFDEKKYVDYINQIRSRFETVVVGITRECFEQRKWINSFSQAGFEVIVSADLSDSAALPKLKLLFSLFDYVTSPNLGSQFIYASLFGCRVSQAGPRLEISKQELGQDPYYQRNPEILEFMFSEELMNFQEKITERFQSDPWEAVTHQSYAECEAGSENKRNASEISSLLGWDFISQVAGISNRLIQRFKKKFL